MSSDPQEGTSDEAEAEADIREQLSDVKESLANLGRGLASHGAERGRAVVDKSREKVDSSYRTITLKEYRDEVDRALADVTQVLLVLDARVNALEDRIADVEGRLDG